MRHDLLRFSWRLLVAAAALAVAVTITHYVFHEPVVPHLINLAISASVLSAFLWLTRRGGRGRRGGGD